MVTLHGQFGLTPQCSAHYHEPTVITLTILLTGKTLPCRVQRPVRKGYMYQVIAFSNPSPGSIFRREIEYSSIDGDLGVSAKLSLLMKQVTLQSRHFALWSSARGLFYSHGKEHLKW